MSPRFNRRGILIFMLMVLVAVGVIVGFLYRSNQNAQAVRDSQRQDYALCVAQNAARQSTRDVATSTYKLIAGVLSAGGVADPQLQRIFEKQEAALAKQLSALRPLDCSTYVRPDIPPDRG